MTEPMKVNLDKCCRCGNKHENMIAHPLLNPEFPHTHYTTCPMTKQPIIIDNIFEIKDRDGFRFVKYTEDDKEFMVYFKPEDIKGFIDHELRTYKADPTYYQQGYNECLKDIFEWLFGKRI